MSDNFENNTNGFEPFDGTQKGETENSNAQPENVKSEESDVFDFMNSSNFYTNPPEQNEKAEESTEIPQPETNNYTNQANSSQPDSYSYGNSYNQNTSYSNGGYGYNNNYSQPQQNGYSQQPPVEPYNFGRSSGNNVPPVNPNYQNAAPSGGGSSKGKKVAAIVIVIAVIVGIFAAVTAFLPDNSGAKTETTTAAGTAENGETTVASSEQVQISTTQTAASPQLTAVEVAEKVRPSVVGVMTYEDGQLSGEGSGVAMSVDSTGKYTYIITCAHVISDKGVTFGILTLDGKSYEASMVAYDSRTDIGVLKVEATDIPLAEFGDSTALKVGETVYAIGNPGGSEYFGSITDGIVSAIDRSISSTYNMTCIQHNAAINPGNSGGALDNSAGQVIGINSSKIAATDFEGMGFAVPMSIVKPVVDNLIQYGYVPNRPKLGIEYASVSSYQLYSMVVAIKGLPAGSLVIAGISNDSSLANTDAQVGDLIIAVNGQDMDSSDVLLDLINTGAVGDTLTLTLCRVENRTYKTTTFDVTITLVEDRGTTEEEETTVQQDGEYYYGGGSSFEDFFNDYFGF